MPDADVTILTSDDATGAGYDVLLVQAPRGTPPPLHTEPWPKTYHLLRGRILVVTDGSGCELAVGDTLTITAGTPNTFSVLTDEAVFLLVCPGTGMRRFFTDLDALRHERLPDDAVASRFAQIAARHGIGFTEEVAS